MWYGLFCSCEEARKISKEYFEKSFYFGSKFSQLSIEGKNLTNLENRIDIQQVHSWSGAKAPAGWRCATNFLPIRVITESKVGSDSEPFWNIRLLRIRRWNDSGTMILPYGAGGVPGRGEIPMSSVSSRTPVDFLLRIQQYRHQQDWQYAENTQLPVRAFRRHKEAGQTKGIWTVHQWEAGDIRGSGKFTNRRRVFSRKGLRKRTLYAIIYL